MHYPVRGGTRGGQDQFKWDDVKSDRDRENYLGHSVMAPVGRWQKGKDLMWYTKDPNENKTSSGEKDDATLRRERIAAIKKAEEAAMLGALGFSASGSSASSKLTKEDLKDALKRESGNNEAEERVRGVGASIATTLAKKSDTEGISFTTPSSSKHRADHKSSDDPRKSDRFSCDEFSKHKKRKKKHKKRHDSGSSSSSDDDDVRKKRPRRRHDTSSDSDVHSSKPSSSQHKKSKKDKKKKKKLKKTRRRHDSSDSD